MNDNWVNDWRRSVAVLGDVKVRPAALVIKDATVRSHTTKKIKMKRQRQYYLMQDLCSSCVLLSYTYTPDLFNEKLVGKSSAIIYEAVFWAQDLKLWRIVDEVFLHSTRTIDHLWFTLMMLILSCMFLKIFFDVNSIEMKKIGKSFQ